MYLRQGYLKDKQGYNIWDNLGIFGEAGMQTWRDTSGLLDDAG